MGAKTTLLPNRELLSKVNAGSNIPALDAVRGIAASMVVIAHTIGPRQLGSIAVNIFLVLSGFLIT
jgi:peptidoglycan/LPS O-acetylase OafA/YrhL